MRSLIDRLGTHRTLLLASAAGLALMAVAVGLGLRLAVHRELADALLRRAQTGAHAVATHVSAPLAAGRDDLVAAELEGSLYAEDDAYTAVLRADGSVAARVVRPGLQPVLAQALARHERGHAPSWVALGGGYAWFEPVPPADARKAGAALVAERPPLGWVVRGMSPGVLEEQLGRARLFAVLLVLAGCAAMAGFAWALWRQLVILPLTEMGAVAARVSELDLGARTSPLGHDELGRLASSLNRIGENLASTWTSMSGVSDGIAVVIERIARAGHQVAGGAETVSARVGETSGSMGEMIVSLKGIADNVEVLAQSADESASSILEMAATNTEVAENIQALAASVEETTAAIEQMTFSIKDVANSIEELSATAEETSSAMNEMDVSISQVETNATETAKLSEQAMKDAELSTEALSRTLAGIGRIKDSSREAAEVIDSLGRKIGTIGNILNVIDEVAEQTNLLALNAAILAAQSGEHGKGFAVVADEIKDLAERTGASTKEISELIRSVQDESANAVAAMDRGVKNVDEGVRLGQEAETALKKIQASSVKSTQMVKAIARATLEQARGSKQVTSAFNRIAETVQQIATATAEQARGSEQIMKSAEKMKIITKHVERSSQEQARGSKQITKAIESISEMVNHLNRAQKDQTKGSEQVMAAVDQIRKVSEAQAASVRELEASITDLARQADVLRSEVRRFKA